MPYCVAFGGVAVLFLAQEKFKDSLRIMLIL